MRLGSSGFNEARADSPGRCGALGIEIGQIAEAASMRPGPIRPGDNAECAMVALVPTRFNEARADSPGRYYRPIEQMDW